MSKTARRAMRLAVLTACALPFAATCAAAKGFPSPTVSEFLNAANVEYIGKGIPVGLTAFLVNGQQLSYTDKSTGVQADVWQTGAGQLIVAFQGTQDFQQFLVDIGVYLKEVTKGEQESAAFVQTALADAAAQGIAASDVFITGHSLGGIEAEYAAQQTGLAGIAFEPTGIPPGSGLGDGSNFVNIVTYGDPVGNYCSDIKGLQPFAPPYVQGGGKLPHYGQIVQIGNSSDQKKLTKNALNLIALFGLLLDYHLPGVQAHDLDVTLSPYSSLIDGIGDMKGAVIDVGNDTISQLLAKYKMRNHAIPHQVAPSAALTSGLR